MRNHKMLRSVRVGSALVLGVLLAAGAAGCTVTSADGKSSFSVTKTVEITDNHGTIDVPVNPKRVVALDNTLMETLSEWDIDLVAVPKGVMGTAWPKYINDDSVIDIGDHQQPNLELVTAAKPDLILTGYRFGSYYDELVAMNPDSVVLEITPRDDEDPFSELMRETEILGQIFEKQHEAEELNTALEESIDTAKKGYNGTDTVMAVNTSAGSIGYLAPGVGRALGPIFPELDLKPALDVAGTDDHKGNDIGVEAIAQSNPDWIFALDRDAAFVPEERDPGSTPAEELITHSEALKNVTAVQKDQIVILDSNFYLTEGIQAYTSLFIQIGAAFNSAFTPTPVAA